MPLTARAKSNFWKVVLLALIAAAVLIGWIVPAATYRQATFLWLSNMGLLLLFSVVSGYVITGLLRGVLIDSRNKISLSRFQMLLWTILILSGFLTAVLINVRRGQTEPLSIALHPTLWGLLGISTASLVGSPLIKNNKKSEPTNTGAAVRTKSLLIRQGASPSGVEAEGQIVVNNDANDASFTDMFKGEEVGNAAFLDLGKVQMFYFTLITWFVYAAALGQMFERSTQSGAPKITGLPDLDTGMVALLGISHAAYLANKAVPHTPQQNNSPP